MNIVRQINNFEKGNEKLQERVNDLNATILKFTNSIKLSKLLLGQPKQTLDNGGLGYDENSELYC